MIEFETTIEIPVKVSIYVDPADPSVGIMNTIIKAEEVKVEGLDDEANKVINDLITDEFWQVLDIEAADFLEEAAYENAISQADLDKYYRGES